jgi:hypothetical protein
MNKYYITFNKRVGCSEYQMVEANKYHIDRGWITFYSSTFNVQTATFKESMVDSIMLIQENPTLQRKAKLQRILKPKKVNIFKKIFKKCFR